MQTQVLPTIKQQDSDERILIVEYFLNLFQLRNGAPKVSRTEFSLINVQNSEYIYKLIMIHGEQRLSRRMSIYKLSENSGSKSNCYKVIYDNLFVVKIPPFPIKNFEEYIKNIDAERRIVAALAPDIQCISPRVSTLLKKITPFSRDANMGPEKFEQKCIHRLRAFPQLQKYLQIGDTFAFFMDLSKHRFLSQVINDIHDVGNKLEKEIIGQTDSLWNQMVFEDIYGANAASVFYRINDLYRDYESRLTDLLRQHRQESSVSIYEKKEWFLYCLAGKELYVKRNFISQAFIDELNCLMESLLKKNYDTIEGYRKTIEEYIHKLTFKQNKPKQQIIIAKVLSMLEGLHQKGVAIRDLKPDNIFVAERTENPILSSADSKDLSIGLIDFETAVRFKSQYDNKIKQPLLAGTPSYATPSHLFPNELLCDAFQDLSRIFHIQDWQAVIVIIYSISTEKHLSEKTGRVLPGLMKIIHDTKMKSMTLTDLFQKGSHFFWHTAAKEFKEKLRIKENMLKTLIITLPHDVKRMLKREINIENDRVNKIIWKQIDSQNIFKSRKSRKILLEASYEIIGKYKNKCESGQNIPKSKTNLRKLTNKFFQEMEYLKLQSEQLAHTVALLDQRPTLISVYDLLELMFNIVLKAMYLEEWGNMSLVSAQFTDELHAETVMMEKNLL